MQMQLLKGDRIKWEMDEGTGANMILYRAGGASSE